MSLEWIAIVVPVMSAIIMGLIALAFNQSQKMVFLSISRVVDRCESIQSEVDEHKANDHEQFNYHANLHHWQGNCIQRVVLKMAVDGKPIELPERPIR